MNRIVVTTVFLLIETLSSNQCLAEPPNKESSEPSVQEMTIRRYFEGQSGYHAGNLITRSQVAELQVYLRRTRNRGSASHPLILQRFLPDSCRLAKLFYKKNGGNVLREAAQKLGGYAGIEALTRSPDSYSQLVEAAASGLVDTVVQLAELAGFGQTNIKAVSAGKKKRRRRTIYTVDEFLSAVSEPPAAKMPPDEPPQPAPKNARIAAE